MHVNNETGVLQPIEEIAERIAGNSYCFMWMLSQSFGKFVDPLRIPEIDLMSISAHKMGGPQGVGALVIRRRARSTFKPLTFGGGQEGGVRPGTLPVHLIAGIRLGAELAGRRGGPSPCLRH